MAAEVRSGPRTSHRLPLAVPGKRPNRRPGGLELPPSDQIPCQAGPGLATTSSVSGGDVGGGGLWGEGGPPTLLDFSGTWQGIFLGRLSGAWLNGLGYT